MIVAAVALAGAPHPAGAATPAAELFYQRSVMTAADAACRLFTPPVSAMLAAAKAQARGAALRSGADAAGLALLEAQAEGQAHAWDCRSAGLAQAAARVRQAFDGFARLDEMRYPGERADWLAQRPADDRQVRWRLSQTVRCGWDRMVFGVAGREGTRALLAVANFADGAEPYGARLVLRDAARTAGPYLDPRAADIRGVIPLEARLPPRSAARIFAAEAMSPAGRDLRPADMDDGWAFRFSPEARAALASLDPREAVAVEFLFAGNDGGESVRTAYVEVGDFAAGEAFEALAQR